MVYTIQAVYLKLACNSIDWRWTRPGSENSIKSRVAPCVNGRMVFDGTSKITFS
jgi:hypothetical protein